MRIENKTKWQTAHLRTIVLRVAKLELESDDSPTPKSSAASPSNPQSGRHRMV